MSKKAAAKTKASAKSTAKPKASSGSKGGRKVAPATKAPKKPVAKPAKPVGKTEKSQRPKKTDRPAATDRASKNDGPRKIERPAKGGAKPPKANGHKGPPSPWLKKQKQRLIELRDTMLDAMDGVARDTLRSRPEGSEASAFGMHQADAGSDAYDRDFALNMLSKEQDALYEIEEALRRMDLGTYGVCEMSGKRIPQARLEAIPFARYTVECQTQLEKENRGGYGRRAPVRSLFGLGTDDEEGEEEEETPENAPAAD
jgi:RNA polymerase-binding transcription factor DksA